ncbi:MAG TPA: hypothetical protein VML75_13570, partial [Kofleriaceae bacterium]|nr:hypothetical protein [Kofleriaceae bacterium]
MATWQTVHASFQQLAFDKATYDIREAHWIREGQATRVWDGVGCATFVEYLNMVLGYRGNTARDRIRTALALADLPEIEDALAGGRICWSAARELTRVATPDTEAAWLEAAEAQPVREIEDMVAGLERGDPPGTVPERGAERRILRFDVSGMTYALFMEASQAITREAGRSLSHDELIDLLARRVLEGPTDPGRSSYQLAITRCSDCSRTFANAAGRLVQVDDAMVEAITCDVQTVPVNGAWG